MNTSLITLQNADLSLVIAAHGAELRSLGERNTNDEYIWQRDPAFWPASAPILFPVIGRMKDGGYTLDGKFYEIPKHGFTREMDFSILASSESAATFRLVDTAETRAAFPFAFSLEVDFRLVARTLEVDYRVQNRADREMPFGLGSHPAFTLPPSMGPLTDWSIGFDTVEPPMCSRVAENLLASTLVPFTYSADNAIELTDKTFEHDALIFKSLRSKRVQLRHRTQGTRLTFDTGGAPTLGIWAKPGAPYVCLEPWCGFDDSSEINTDLFAKPALMRLAAGGTFTTGYKVTV